VRETTPALAADLVLFLQAMGKQAGLFYVLKEANAFGAALLSSDENSFLKTLEAIEKGDLAALVLVETDPFWFFPDRSRLKQALSKLEFLLVIDYLLSPTVSRSDIFLPSQTLFEAGGIYVNQEGRAQWAPPVFKGGLPVEQVSAGGHPPHLFTKDIPGGEPRPAGHILMDLGRFLSPNKEFSFQALWTELARGNLAFSNFQDLKDQLEGIRIIPDQKDEKFSSFNGPVDTGEKGRRSNSVELILVDKTFGTEELSAYSRPLREAGGRPYLTMATETGKRIGIQNKDHVVLSLDNGELELAVELTDHIAAGVMILPRHESLAWQKITAFPIWVSLDRITKASKPEVA
ncbi:MAG: molybdopterin-dependent oxidoreductase, partial [Thermodesulfobacteriota bacterium]